MITFSVNPTEEQIGDAGASVVSKKKPVAHYSRFESLGISEGFVKTVDGYLDQPIKVGAFGYVVEKNTKMAISSKEVPILTVDEIEAGRKGGVSEAVFKVKDFSDNDRWLESLDTDYEVIKAVFDLVEIEIYNHKKKWLRLVIEIALRTGRSKDIDYLGRLIEEFNDFSRLPLVSQDKECFKSFTNPSMIQKVIIYLEEHSLRDLVGYIITNKKAADAVGLS
ncbi:hypothetical protein J27TS7_15840 [Paenibacillus dendritiformis]|uniref:hypothetical protein n=1 Tax=Paenibacillus dendritiformis TaxID=130049 RepID=UPI001B0543E9|nr:hypothetical protein [Paenibacillus dendritiformis]GIO72070.1 hypothetical protein J27TS7_15840 [Paenibacillus dendritiformis]